MSIHIKSILNKFSYNVIVFFMLSMLLKLLTFGLLYICVVKNVIFNYLKAEHIPYKSGIRPPVDHYYTFYMPFHFDGILV